MPFYDYRCSSCDLLTEMFYASYKERPSVVPCRKCGDSAHFEISAGPHIHWKFTDKEVRIPSNPLSVSVDGFKVVEAPKQMKKQLRKNGRRIPAHKLRKEKEPKPKPS